jgi:hypothetical protein
MRTQIYEISSTRAAASKRIQSKSTGDSPLDFFMIIELHPVNIKSGELSMEHFCDIISM